MREHGGVQRHQRDEADGQADPDGVDTKHLGRSQRARAERGRLGGSAGGRHPFRRAGGGLDTAHAFGAGGGPRRGDAARCSPGEAQQRGARPDRGDVDGGEAVGLPVDWLALDQVALERGQAAEQELGPAERDHPARDAPRLAAHGDLPLADEGVALVAHLEQGQQPPLLRAQWRQVLHMIVAREALAGGMHGLARDLQRVGCGQRALIGGDDRHDLRPEAGELGPEQLQMAVGDGDRRRLCGILVERHLQQAIVGVARERARDRALQRLLRIVQPLGHERRQHSCSTRPTRLRNAIEFSSPSPSPRASLVDETARASVHAARSAISSRSDRLGGTSGARSAGAEWVPAPRATHLGLSVAAQNRDM